jgi:DNA-binding response OmpR family regulator
MAATDRVVLLGEPDQATCELYRRALSAAFEVVATSDEAAILQMLHARPVAALVLEPAIFAKPGWEQLAEISHECAERAVPLVICTTQDERQQGLKLGAAAYLVKPTLPATLLNTIYDLVGSGRS